MSYLCLQQERNQTALSVIWQFLTPDARVQLKHLCPVFESEKYVALSNALF